MNLAFLSPLGGLLALAGLVPAAAWLVARRRAQRARAALALAEPSRRGDVLTLAAMGTVASLLALAATQPLLQHVRTRHVRTDAEAWVVMDTSRSMLARESVDSPTRLDRAKTFARALRGTLGSVPVGIASLTDRALPHLFPSSDADAFDATLRDAIGIERPPPTRFFQIRATSFATLDDVRLANFYAPDSPHRLLVVLSDGESQPFAYDRLGRLMRQQPQIHTIIVRFWHRGERVYTNGQVESAYRPDPGSALLVNRVAEATGGQAFGEAQLGAVAGTARRDLGRGREAAIGETHGQTQLAPYVSLAALVPLSLLLWRRNL